MEKILNVVGVLLIAIGTIFSLWTILSTRKDFIGTALDFDTKSEQFGKEKKLVIIGCVLIVLGSVLQICFIVL